MKFCCLYHDPGEGENIDLEEFQHNEQPKILEDDALHAKMTR